MVFGWNHLIILKNSQTPIGYMVRSDSVKIIKFYFFIDENYIFIKLNLNVKIWNIIFIVVILKLKKN
jgi:hypothetical protein